MGGTTLTPIVKWAQNGPQIDLTIDLSDVTNPNIQLTETKLYFSGFGHGARGEDLYIVDIEFFSMVDHLASSYNIIDRNISFKILKQIKSEEWPRLLKDVRKPAWLKIDFDKWKVSDDEEEAMKNRNDQDVEDPYINRISFEQRMKSDKEKSNDDLFIYSKIAWLSTYYVFQIVCFSVVIVEIMKTLASEGTDAYKLMFRNTAGILLTSQIVAFMEIVHPLIGVNKISVRAPLLNVGVRNFILFVLIAPVKEMHDTYATAILIFVWTINELIRFPHNLFQMHGFHHWVLTWIRYSYWLLVYPIGFVCGGIIIYQSSWIAAESNRLEYPLPNVWNISFTLATFLRIMFCFYGPGCAYFLKHMWILRRRKVAWKKRAKAD